MIQTQSQNEEIRQIRNKVMISSRCKDEDKVGNEVCGKVWLKVRGKVRSEVWRKLLR